MDSNKENPEVDSDSVPTSPAPEEETSGRVEDEEFNPFKYGNLDDNSIHSRYFRYNDQQDNLFDDVEPEVADSSAHVFDEAAAAAEDKMGESPSVFDVVEPPAENSVEDLLDSSYNLDVFDSPDYGDGDQVDQLVEPVSDGDDGSDDGNKVVDSEATPPPEEGKRRRRGWIPLILIIICALITFAVWQNFFNDDSSSGKVIDTSSEDAIVGEDDATLPCQAIDSVDLDKVGVLKYGDSLRYNTINPFWVADEAGDIDAENIINDVVDELFISVRDGCSPAGVAYWRNVLMHSIDADRIGVDNNDAATRIAVYEKETDTRVAVANEIVYQLAHCSDVQFVYLTAITAPTIYVTAYTLDYSDVVFVQTPLLELDILPSGNKGLTVIRCSFGKLEGGSGDYVNETLISPSLRAIVYLDRPPGVQVFQVVPSSDELPEGSALEDGETSEGPVPDSEGDQSPEDPVPAPEDGEKSEEPTPAPKDDQKSEEPVPAPEEEKSDEEPVPAPEDGQTSEESAPAPKDDETSEEPVPAPEEEKSDEEPVPAPEDGETSEESAPAPEDDETSEEPVPAPEEDESSEESAPDPEEVPSTDNEEGEVEGETDNQNPDDGSGDGCEGTCGTENGSDGGDDCTSGSCPGDGDGGNDGDDCPNGDCDGSGGDEGNDCPNGDCPGDGDGGNDGDDCPNGDCPGDGDGDYGGGQPEQACPVGWLVDSFGNCKSPDPGPQGF